MTSEAGEIMEKLKEKNAEYEAIASTDSSVNLKNIDNRIITEVLGLERYGWRLRDQIAQMQASTVNQITEVQRKCEEIQQQLRADAVARKAAVAARKVEVAAMAAEQSRKKGWILVKTHIANLPKLAVFVTKAPLKVMAFSGASPANAAKSHDF
ncbi:Tyrosine-protein kinase Btk29A [Gossypium arboreum]|uniref:Tyrosine-protein kinase Btk29A n=1 Tax=Gossypium arboreum TaxID=29729 RepID=A0A0B0MIV4_GOSAR|nr:Tyrosine-protein kinase Btk29A [Gossypium arboreum]